MLPVEELQPTFFGCRPGFTSSPPLEEAEMSQAHDADSPDIPSGGEKTALIKYLRDEAYAVRDCFTRYSVQVMSVSGGLLVAIAKFQTDNPYVGLLSIFPVILILLVLQMGVHKYATSNRLLGYELHLQRTSHYITRDHCHKIIQNAGWEVAMRAWRVVQPTLWETIYEPRKSEVKSGVSPAFLGHIYAAIEAFIAKSLGNLFSYFADAKRFNLWYYPIFIKCQIEKSIILDQDSNEYVGYWFDQARAFDRLSKGETKLTIRYNPGGYLATMLFLFILPILICFGLQYLALAQMWIGNHSASAVQTQEFSIWVSILNVLATIFVITSSVAGAASLKNINSRIKILESGLLSIHSCAILWEAVVLAHVRALEELHFFDESYPRKTMHGYTKAIAGQASEICSYATKIHQWIDEVRANLDEKLRKQALQIVEKSLSRN
jgi:hypothetical protein